MDTIGRLRRVPLFRHLSAAQLEHVAHGSRTQAYRKGDALFRQGRRARACWIVSEGWVHLLRSRAPEDPGHSVMVFTITPAEVLCGLSALDAGSYSVSAIAGTDCVTVRIPAELLTQALLREPAFAYHALRLCTRRIRHIAEQYGSMAEPVAHRIVRAILRLSQQFGRTLPVTHRELAQMSWTTTESAIRIVRTLKRQGSLTGRRGELTIANRTPLQQLLERASGQRMM